MSQEQLKEFAKKYDGKVAKLLCLGRDKLLRVDIYSYVEKFGFTHADVEQLLMLAQDRDIYQHDYSDIPKDEGLEFYGVVHAWNVLSELEVKEAQELFIDMLEDGGYEDDADDWILSGFRRLIKPFRKDMYEYFAECAALGGYGVWTRMKYISTIGDMLKAKEVEPQKVDELIVKILSSNDNAIVNAGVISLCMDEKLIKHHALIKQCFERRAVDIDHIGDLEDVEIDMGLRDKRETERELTEIQKMFSGLREMAERYFEEDTIDRILPFVKEEPKIGRNDPCPCGSGKKYKKCCLNK